MTVITRGELGRRTHLVTLQVLATSTADEIPVFYNNFRQSVTITAAKFIPTNAITGDNTNSMTLTLRNKGTAGTGTTAVTSALAFLTGTNADALTPTSLTLSTTDANLIVAAGEVLGLNKAVGGSGITLEGQLLIEYTFDSAA